MAVPGFQTTFVIGRAPEQFGGEVLPMALEAGAVLPVEDLLCLADGLADVRPALVITDRDLSMPECASLFGYADRSRGLAVVSTFRLGGGERMTQRLQNLIAHELGHLEGREHCRQSACLMRPVKDAGELDQRPLTVCGKCTEGRRGWVLKPIAAVLFLGGLVVCGDFLLGKIAPVHASSPFTCLTHDPAGHATPGAAGSADIAHINFQGKMLFCLRDRAGHKTVRDRSLPLAVRLNELWSLDRPLRFTVTPLDGNSARIDEQGKLVVEVKPSDVVQGDALSTGRVWVQALSLALSAKNAKAEAAR